jgi:NDP-sugar pyrophosphorylase family protein
MFFETDNNRIAFVLAAGSGTRMLPLTKVTPKPLLKINSKPMIDYVLGLLKFYGFTKIGINTFSLSEKIEGYLSKAKLKIVTVIDKALTGTAGGVLAIAKKLKPDFPFIVISSDMMVNFNLKTVYNFHLRHKGIATICCFYRTKSNLVLKKSGLVLFDRKTKEVTQIIERPDKIISQWINSSVYVFKPEVLEILKKFKKKQIDIPRDLLPNLLKSGKKIYAYPVNSKKFYQLGVDTPDRIKQVEKDLISGKFIPVN